MNSPKPIAFDVKSFIAQYPEAVFVAGWNKEALLHNKAFERLSGSRAIKDLGAFLPPDSDTWQWNKPGCSTLHLIHKNDGNSVLTRVTVSEIEWTSDTSALIFTFLDLSEAVAWLNQQTQSELAHLNKELKRSNEELEQFAYAASHDLQEPLRMINGYVQLMQKQIAKGNTAGVEEFMGFITGGVSRMQSLINDLLQFSRVNRKGKPFTEVKLNEVVQIALSHLSEKMKEDRAQVNCPDLPVVNGDSFQLIRLFQNLIDNAIKFHRAGVQPEIEISVNEREECYLFGIKDNGIGIEAKFHSRIFAIFQRLHTRAEYEGTGIGLAVCKKIVERHGGDIWIESEPGEGSTFYFTIKK